MTQLVTLAAITKPDLETWLNATLEIALGLEWTNGESASAVIGDTICDIFHDADWCNIAFNGPSAARLKGTIEAAILAAGTTGQITATRGTLTWPGNGSGIPVLAYPATPSHGFAGVEVAASPEVDVVDPLDVYPEWYQRTPGVETDVPQVGTIEHLGGVLYLCETAQSGGNYFTPGTVGSGWRAITSGPGYDPWSAGTTYALNDRVTDEGEDWLNRDQTNTGRKPGSASAGWLRISNMPYPYYHLGNAGYPVTVDGQPVQVTDAGRLWQVTQDGAGNSSFPPSVVPTGWVDVGPAP